MVIHEYSKLTIWYIVKNQQNGTNFLRINRLIKTKVNLGLDSEFDSIHFGIENNKRLKFLTPISFWVLKF